MGQTHKAATNEYVEQFGDTYEILVLSQGVQAENFSSAEEALNAAFGSAAPWNTSTTVAVPTFIKTAEELKAALNSIGTLGTNETLNIVLGADISLGSDWNIMPKENTSTATVLIDGNGYTIKNLTSMGKDNAGLISWLKFAGSITIRNLKLDGFNLTGTDNVNNEECAGGAVIGYYEAHDPATSSLTLENVHVTGAKIQGYKYIGGLVGYQTDGYASVTITNCSVNGATLDSTYAEGSESKGHVGGLIGQAYAAKLTGNTVKNTVITGSTGTEPNRAGAMIGTAQAGVVIGTGNKVANVKINNATENVKIVGYDLRTNKSDVDGVDDGTDTNTNLISNNAEFTNAVANGGGKTITLTAGTYEFTNQNNPVWENVTIVGNPGVVIKADSQTFNNVKFVGVTFESGTNGTRNLNPIGDAVTFENCTFTSGTGDADYAFHSDTTYVKNMTFRNCVFNNGVVVYGDGSADTKVTFENCEFNFAKAKWGNLRSYCDTTMNDCNFNLNGINHRVVSNAAVTVSGGNYFNKVYWTGDGTVNGEHQSST